MMAGANLSGVIFKLSKRELSSEVTVTPAAWRVLAQCDGARSVAEIARALAMDEATVAQVADTFFRCGILQLAPGSPAPPRPPVNKAFFDRLTNELARAIGPLAALTVEDEMAALGEARESFPRDEVPELVERLSHLIRDDARRLAFQQVMLEAIRKL
jgi:hypothetical protein